MTLELRVVSGARAGSTERFDTGVVMVGRHPTSDLRFDPQEDLDVSARHAELRLVGGAWSVHDQGSTNGTFVNGEKIESERAITTGDTITFGTHGPSVEVTVHAPRVDTNVRVAAAVREQTASMTRTMYVGAAAVLVLIVAAVAALAAWQRRAVVDFTAIHARNDAAVAMIASDLDGTFTAGTAFGVDSTGLLVTNRHVVRSAAGRPARRLRVIYGNTTAWLPAHIVRLSERDDLALVQVDDAGMYPVVSGLRSSAEGARVGAAIASIGYPHAVSTPMEGTGLHITARSTTTVGTVSKRLDDVVQIDSYAGQGSSGAPVFDTRGALVGVVYGGAPESSGRIVYAVPASRLMAFLADAPAKAAAAP